MDPHFPSAQRALYDSYEIKVPGRFQLLYDRLVFHLGNLQLRRLEQYIHQICQRFQLKGKKILDIGAHTGYNSFLMQAAGNEVSALDISKHIDYARKRYAAYGMRFIASDALSFLESADTAPFDFIFVCNFPAHYDSKQIQTSPYAAAFFKAALGKLNPDGKLYYAFYSEKHNKVDHPVTEEAMREALQQWGIKNFELGSRKYADNNNLLELVIPAAQH